MDMLVKDIYGGAYSLIGLREDIIACSFGKAARSPRTATTLGRFVVTDNIIVANL